MEGFHSYSYLKITSNDFWKPRDLERDHKVGHRALAILGNNTLSKNI